MARLARVVVPGVAHHVAQRGNRRQQTSFDEDDYRACLALLGEWCGMWNSIRSVPGCVACRGDGVGPVRRPTWGASTTAWCE